MKRKVIVVLATALMVVMALPAGAARPIGVHIAVETFLLTFTGPFTASGPAVDDGLICASGSVIDDVNSFTGFTVNGFNYHGIKRFTCDDTSGEFLVNVQARIDNRTGTTFNWNVIAGTGAYEDLHGAGPGVALDGGCGAEPCVLDVYDGTLHIE